MTQEQAQIDQMRAQAAAAVQVAEAEGESKSRLLKAQALEAENKADGAKVTPMEVEEHAYDALGKLGGSGTTILLGDPSKLPGWLFPKVPGFTSAFNPAYVVPPIASAPTASATPPAPGGHNDDGNQ